MARSWQEMIGEALREQGTVPFEYDPNTPTLEELLTPLRDEMLDRPYRQPLEYPRNWGEPSVYPDSRTTPAREDVLNQRELDEFYSLLTSPIRLPARAINKGVEAMTGNPLYTPKKTYKEDVESLFAYEQPARRGASRNPPPTKASDELMAMQAPDESEGVNSLIDRLDSLRSAPAMGAKRSGAKPGEASPQARPEDMFVADGANRIFRGGEGEGLTRGSFSRLNKPVVEQQAEEDLIRAGIDPGQAASIVEAAGPEGAMQYLVQLQEEERQRNRGLSLTEVVRSKLGEGVDPSILALLLQALNLPLPSPKR